MHSEKIEKSSINNKTALQGGGQDRIKAQHEKGKLTARERIDLLLDEGTFTELDPLTTHHYHEYDMQKKKFFTDGVVGGYGNITGRQIFVFAYDFTVLGGTLSQMGAKKITKLMDHAVKTGCPIIGIMDSGGARIQEGIMSLDGFADIFYHNQLASGVIPQITASIGPSAGGSVYSPAMTDFVIMVEKVGTMFVTGPDVVKTVLGEEISFDELGGAMTHGSKNHRAPGSIGMGTSPGRVLPGKKMAGQLGNKQTSVRKLRIVQINTEENILVVKGSIPGKPGNLINITKFK